MEVKKLHDNYRPHGREPVRMKLTGHIAEIMWCEKRNHTMYIRKIDDNHYIDLREEPDPETGEVILHEFCRSENRSENKSGVARSLSRLRDLINTNVVEVDNARWITLTYAENMTDTKKLYDDFKNFNKRMRYKLGEKYEYIVAAEPQGRGAWHMHMLMLFSHKAPFIPNSELAEIWGHGFVTVKKLDSVDNVGAYLTAYLGDMELSEARASGLHGTYEVKEVMVQGEDVPKRYVKGGRLHLYPPKFNLYRFSRGIKKPVVEVMSNEMAEKKVSAGTLTFEKTLKIVNGDFESHLNYRYYKDVL